MHLSNGQNITPVVEKDETFQESVFCPNCHDNRQAEYYRSVSLSCLSSRMSGADYNNHICCFPIDIVSTAVLDFDPYPCDRIEVQFYSQPGTQNRKVLSVRPRRNKHVYEVRITSVHGRNGVIGNATFFTLDSLTVPDGYVPQIHDVVNAVIVETIRLGYIWRAVSITPVVTV